MVSDYLFCGTCFLNFRLCDINLFIEHKKNNCGSNNAGQIPSRDPMNSTTDAFVANLLECVQCFRRFSTAWPLLLHVQFEHQMLFASAFKHRSQLEERHLNFSENKNSTTSKDPLPSHSDDQTGITSSDHRSVSVETQTLLSSLRGPMRNKRKRVHPICCISARAPETVNEVSVPIEGCGCNGDNNSKNYGDLERYCPSSAVICNCRCPCSSNSQNNHSVGDPQSEQANTCVPYENMRPASENTDLPLCCAAGVLHNKLSPDYSQKSILSCCPCSPIAMKKPTASSETQTDFGPESFTPDYEDIAMLLFSPSKSNAGSPSPTDLNCNETTTDAARYNFPLLMTPSNTSPLQTPNTMFDGNTLSVLPSDSGTTTMDLFSTGNTIPYSGGDSALNATITFSTTSYPSTMLRYEGSAPISSVSKSSPIAIQSGINPTLISDSHMSSIGAQFTCEQCGRVYRQKVHLRKHIMVQHVGKKPFECPICNYTTVEKSHLTVHIRTHTGERPFHCRVCDYSSSQNCTLKSHYMRKHSDNQLHCNKCSEMFYTEQELQKHERQCYFSKLNVP